MDDMFEKYSVAFEDDEGADSENSEEDSVDRVRRMAEEVAEGADDASEPDEEGGDEKIERIRPPTPTASQRARAVLVRSCVHPKPPKECTDTCHPFHHGTTEGSGTFGSGANVFTDKGTRRLAAVLNDRLTSDSDRKAACTLIHTSCYDEANAKLVVDIDIVPQIIKIAKHDGFDSKAEACCALAVLAIHFPEHIVEAIPTLTGLLEAPAVVSGSAAWALSTLAADDDHRVPRCVNHIVAALDLTVRFSHHRLLCAQVWRSTRRISSQSSSSSSRTARRTTAGATPPRASGTWPVTTTSALIAWARSTPWWRWPTSATRSTRGGGPRSRWTA